MRLRQQFVYYGAHTGRWSGRDVQPHNLTRAKTGPAVLAALVDKTPVESIVDLSTAVRPCIRAPKGKKLVVADLNAIEVRGLWWLSGCDNGLQVFKDGLCPYKNFATNFFRIPYDKVSKDQRQFCKPPVLGCGYGLGPGQERHLQNGQIALTGLREYGRKMGQTISQPVAFEMVDLYRSEYNDVPKYWRFLEQAFLGAYEHRVEQQVGPLFVTAADCSVNITLPSGRNIHYLNPHAYRYGRDIVISFEGQRQTGWGRQTTWGGKLTENVVQAVARDVLAVGMLRAEAVGFEVVGHVHDELVCLADVNGKRNYQLLERCLRKPMPWAPDLPLDAEGYEDEFYMKH